MEQLKSLFVHWAGEPCLQCLSLGGGGSSRRYFRLMGASHSCIGTIANDLRENLAFFAYTRHLHAKGMPVPELYAVSNDNTHYLQQDLGDLSLYQLLSDKKRQGGGFDAQMLALYKQVLSDLDALQRAGSDMDFSVGFPRPAFDRRSMMWDLNYFKYYFLKINHIQFDEELIENDFERLVDFLLQADCHYFLYRDFQGRNIMLAQRPYYIDYQGGRQGAAQYDVASLLYSAKSDLPDSIRQELLQHYVRLHGDPTFMLHFGAYAFLRILQTLGAYGYRGLYERKPYFVESIPLALNNLKRLIQEKDLGVDLPELMTACMRCTELTPTVPPSLPAEFLTVTVLSFSYKQGLPVDPTGNGGGHIFDCRALPNPGRYAEYRTYTGKDKPVVDFLSREPAVDHFLAHTQAIVSQSIEKYTERRFSNLQVAFGCTGGQHRSVYCAEQTAAWIARHFPQVHVLLKHREQD